MKKLILTLVAMLAVACTAQAQGTWKKESLEVDELLGQTTGTRYTYTDGALSFEFEDFAKLQFTLHSNEVFDTHTIRKLTNTFCGVDVKVGIYALDGTLYRKFTMWLDVADNGNSLTTRQAKPLFTPSGQAAKVKEIFSVLKHGNGYVRIVAPHFQAEKNFDLKIMPYNQQQ